MNRIQIDDFECFLPKELVTNLIPFIRESGPNGYHVVPQLNKHWYKISANKNTEAVFRWGEDKDSLYRRELSAIIRDNPGLSAGYSLENERWYLPPTLDKPHHLRPNGDTRLTLHFLSHDDDLLMRILRTAKEHFDGELMFSKNSGFSLKSDWKPLDNDLGSFLNDGYIAVQVPDEKTAKTVLHLLMICGL